MFFKSIRRVSHGHANFVKNGPNTAVIEIIASRIANGFKKSLNRLVVDNLTKI